MRCGSAATDISGRRKKGMKIAVVIPSFIKDLKNLEKTLQTISEQTRLPDLVIVHISSIPSENILAPLRGKPYPFSFQMVSVTEKRNAAENRNAGACWVPDDFDVISFFDSDDWMHPRRVEYIERAFQEPIDVVLHNILRETPESFISWDTAPYVLHTQCCYMKEDSARCYIMIDGDQKAHQSAHVSVRREVCDEVLFPATEAISRAEDTLYIAQLYHVGFRFGYIEAKLSVYIQQSMEYKSEKLIDGGDAKECI
jgi:glycosyltransferase involved in cell wall biosynthesis